MPITEGTFSMKFTPEIPVRKLKRGLQEAMEYALLKVAHRLLADSRIYVPVLTGALKDSGKVELIPTLTDAVRYVQVTYNTDYAEKQHERPYRHPSLGFYGAAKYLAKPLEAYGPFYMQLFTLEFDSYVEEHGLA